MRVNINDYVAESILVQESSEGPTNPVEVFGSRIVLAAGGIQNARLLKISLSKESKNIGAYFCQHQYPLYFGGSIILDKDVLEKVIDRKNSRIAHAIALSSGFSKIHSIKSAVFSVSPQNHSAKNLLGQNKYTFTSGINIYAEMSSLVSNRVTLSNTHKDFLGQPIAHINFQFIPQEIHAAAEFLNAELVRSGLGRMSTLPKEFPIGGGGHMIGTTRMGNNPNTSVTDAQGRVHGVKNLYVAGSSLFPAAAAAHPTLTIVALSLRLATHLERSK